MATDSKLEPHNERFRQAIAEGLPQDEVYRRYQNILNFESRANLPEQKRTNEERFKALGILKRPEPPAAAAAPARAPAAAAGRPRFKAPGKIVKAVFEDIDHYIGEGVQEIKAGIRVGAVPSAAVA